MISVGGPPAHPRALLPLSRLDVEPRALLGAVTTSQCRPTRPVLSRDVFSGRSKAFHLLSLIAGTTMTIRRGVKDTVALNLLENDWSSVVQWMYHRLRRKRGRGGGSSTQSFLLVSLVQNNSHVLAFWQVSSREEEGYLKDFLVSPPRRRFVEGGKRRPFLPREPYNSFVYSSRAPRLPLLRRSIVFALFHRVYSREVSLFRIK